MKNKIIKQTKNPLMHREELLIEVEADKNPSFDEIKTIIGKDAELIVVKKVKGNFGRNIFNAEAFVYESKETKDKVEKIPRKQKLKLAEAAKAAAGATAS